MIASFQRYRAFTRAPRAGLIVAALTVAVAMAVHAAGTPREQLAERGLQFSPSVLMEQAAAGNLEAVRLFVAAGMSANARAGDGTTPLLAAARAGRVELARLLIDRGADIDLAYPSDHDTLPGATPLIIAAMHGHLELVRLLLQRGADVDAVMVIWSDDTALDRADDPSIINLLKAAGAISLRDSW